MKILLITIGLAMAIFSFKLGGEFSEMVQMAESPAPGQFPVAEYWMNEVVIHFIDTSATMSPSPADLAGKIQTSINLLRYLGFGFAILGGVMLATGKGADDN